MQVEIPYDDVESLQISLRNHSNLPPYNPDSTSLPKLSSLHHSISQIDPSPHYLRCKHCQGRLLRGVKSFICVFCGKQPFHTDVVPEPIKFLSTVGSQWFLHSLGLNGSEVVDLSIRENESNRGPNRARNEIPLSDLLDLEIVWPIESDKNEATALEMTPAQRLATLNFDGVDLDNFFPEEKFESVPSSSDQLPEVNKLSSVSTGDASEKVANVDLSLFENVQPSDTVGTANVDESDDDFSGWATEFQYAGSGVQHAEPKVSDPFVGSSSIDLSAQMDSVFGSSKEISDEKTKDLSAHMDSVFGSSKDISDEKTKDLSAHTDSVFGSSKGISDEKTKENSTSVSNTDDWLQGDIWSSPNTGTSDQEFKVPTNDNNSRTVGNANDFSSMNGNWFQDDQFQITSGSTKAAKDKTIDEDDSFDVWNDFASSSVQIPSKDISKTDVISTTHRVDESTDLNFLGESSDSQNVDMVNFSQTDFFSGPFNNQNVSTGLNVLQSEASTSNRAVGTDEIEEAGDAPDGNAVSKADDAEILMSQMHDLSFMLENNLSIPKKVDHKKNDPFGSFYED